MSNETKHIIKSFILNEVKIISKNLKSLYCENNKKKGYIDISNQKSLNIVSQLFLFKDYNELLDSLDLIEIDELTEFPVFDARLILIADPIAHIGYLNRIFLNTAATHNIFLDNGCIEDLEVSRVLFKDRINDNAFDIESLLDLRKDYINKMGDPIILMVGAHAFISQIRPSNPLSEILDEYLKNAENNRVNNLDITLKEMEKVNDILEELSTEIENGKEISPELADKLNQVCRHSFNVTRTISGGNSTKLIKQTFSELLGIDY